MPWNLLNSLRTSRIVEQRDQRVFLVGENLAIGRTSILRKLSEELALRRRLSSLSIAMIVGTVSLAAFAPLRRATLTCLIARWVVLEFFPPVALPAAILQWTAVSVGSRVLFGLPVGALDVVVVEGMGCSSVVLPIVSINTLVPLVLFVAERTPHCLEVEHVEVSVAFHFLE